MYTKLNIGYPKSGRSRGATCISTVDEIVRRGVSGKGTVAEVLVNGHAYQCWVHAEQA